LIIVPTLNVQIRRYTDQVGIRPAKDHRQRARVVGVTTQIGVYVNPHRISIASGHQRTDPQMAHR
jgi:hypothetical protein